MLTDGPEVPLVATEAVARVVVADDAEKNSVVGPMMGAEWPTTRRFPDRIVDEDTTLTFGDREFTVSSRGAAESHTDTVWSLADDTLFAGDLVYAGEHAYLADGHGPAWIETLDHFATTLSPRSRLLVGHGAGGGPELIARQQTYVRTFPDAVAATLDIDPVERERLVLDAVRPLASSDRLLFLSQLSIEPTVAAM